MKAGTKRAGHTLLWMGSLAIGLTAACGQDPDSSGGRAGINGAAGYGGAGGVQNNMGGRGGAGGLVIDNPNGGTMGTVVGGIRRRRRQLRGAQITASRILPTVMLVSTLDQHARR